MCNLVSRAADPPEEICFIRCHMPFGCQCFYEAAGWLWPREAGRQKRAGRRLEHGPTGQQCGRWPHGVYGAIETIEVFDNRLPRNDRNIGVRIERRCIYDTQLPIWMFG